MYKLNYLSILLILIAFFVFYNEFNKQLNISEMALLAISFIAILRASYNYIELDNTNKIYEGFSTKNNRNKKQKKKYNNNDDDNEELKLFNEKYNDIDSDSDIIMNSEDSNIYLDVEREDRYANMNNTNTVEKITNVNTNSKLVNDTAINSINNLLGIHRSKELFNNISDDNEYNENNESNGNDEIKSVFMPKIVIGKQGDNDDKNSKDKNTSDNNQEKWNTVFKGNEFDVINKRTSSGTSSGTSSRTSNEYSTTLNYTDKKKCAKYTSRDTDLVNEIDDGNFLVKEYKQSRTWNPGYTYLPPSNWDVPQKYPPVCLSSPNVFKLTGLTDRGLPINALELDHCGDIANTEDGVQLTNVGSMLPKFKFEEMPFSKPYM
jgi:hypothetical protein